MPKFKTARFKELIKELSQDPKIKAAIETINDKSKLGQHVRSLKDFLPFITKLSKFAGRRTLVVAEIITLVIFLFEVSVYLKTNVFDRPEVKQFFSENWGLLQKRVQALYLFCSNYVRMQLAKRKLKAKLTKDDQDRAQS